MHLKRATLVRQNGSVRHHRKWSPRSKCWYVAPLKEKKSFPHLHPLQARMFLFHINTGSPVQQRLSLSASHPQQISVTIANVPPPSTADIAADQKSRSSQNSCQLLLGHSFLTFFLLFLVTQKPQKACERWKKFKK